MRVFVTGATGFIGSAIVKELIEAGHQVLGLVRSDASAKVLIATGAEAHRGDVEDLESLRSGAAQADAVIHTAFIHDFSNFKASCETDRRAIEAMGAVLVGSDRHLITTSGMGLLNYGRLTTEDDIPNADSNSVPRVASEEAAAAVAAKGVKVSLVRLPPSVHDRGDHGFIPILIGLAREKGVAAYLNEGLNRWPAVHRLDAARLYRLILEKGTQTATYHAVADEGVPFKEIAAAIGKGINVPVASKADDDANNYFGWFKHFASLDCPASSHQTQQLLGWQPNHPSLMDDLSLGHYFQH